jgi:rhodanese-related sulfurtransferase
MNTIDAHTLKQWIDRGEALVIDVREPAEHASQHIKEAQLIPLGQLSNRVFSDAKDKKLVIHCRSGVRGERACSQLLKEHPDLDIYHLEGGINAWHEKGLPTHGSGRSVMPLDRQVQLSVGLLVLLTSVMGYISGSHAWFWITGFFGAGLSFAGITGFCGLAKLLAAMPWNQRV